MNHLIWLLGGSGYVGKAYADFFSAHEINYVNISRSDLDYSNPTVLSDALKTDKPTFVINCAGYTGKPNVDACELHKTECLNGNAILPGVLMTAFEEAGVPWGHVSSGCIFTGRRADGGGFTEEDDANFSFRTNNCSFYSGTKALGEEILRDAKDCYIWRLRIPFNEVDSSRNYLSKVMRYSRLLAAENSLSQLDEFVRATWECWEKRVPFGIYNVTNPGSVTTREVVEIIKKTGVSDKDFSFFESEDEFMHIAAKTPRSNCVLDTTKLQNAGISMTEVHEAVETALKNWKSER